MTTIIQLIFDSDPGNLAGNLALLIFRVLLSLELFRVHGMKKFRSRNGQTEHVPNPLHLPGRMNRSIALLSDTIAPAFIILGLGTRLAALPVIAVTAVGYFIVHRNDPPEVRDIPFMYTLCFAFLFVMGAGTFSLDQYLYTTMMK